MSHSASRLSSFEFARIALAAAVCIAGVLATRERNLVWTDGIKLWQSALAVFPENAKAHNGLGLVCVCLCVGECVRERVRVRVFVCVRIRERGGRERGRDTPTDRAIVGSENAQALNALLVCPCRFFSLL